MPVHPAVTLTGTQLAAAAYRSPEEQHELMRNHIEAWLRDEMRAPSFLAFGRPGYTLHRQFVSSPAGEITTDCRTRVGFVREWAHLKNLSTISFAGMFPDTAKKSPPKSTRCAVFLLITCSQDRAIPICSGWRLRSSELNSPIESVRSLPNPDLLVDSSWNEVFDFKYSVSIS